MHLSPIIAAVNNKAANVAFIVVLVAALLVFAVTVLVAMWKTFRKAGKPGWAIFVPFYSGWTEAKIGGKPGGWGLVASLAFSIQTTNKIPAGLEVVLGLVGFVALVFSVLIGIGIARNFGKSTAFGIFWLGLFPFVGYLLLGYGDAKYAPKPQV